MTAYSYTILYVENVEKTLAFYTEAFGFTQKLLTPEKDYGELDTGSTTLAFAAYSVAEYNGIQIQKHRQSGGDAQMPPPFEVAFVTDDIDATWKQALAAGALVVKEPAVKPWGQTVGYVKDINGFLVEVCTPVAH